MEQPGEHGAAVRSGEGGAGGDRHVSRGQGSDHSTSFVINNTNNWQHTSLHSPPKDSVSIHSVAIPARLARAADTVLEQRSGRGSGRDWGGRGRNKSTRAELRTVMRPAHTSRRERGIPGSMTAQCTQLQFNK